MDEPQSLMSLLQDAARRANGKVFLAAPFVKLRALELIIDLLPAYVEVTLVTRWRVDEILAGVSDIEVFDLLSNRYAGNSKLYLADSLHAKYYRFDDVVYFGSANLTLTGLGSTGSAIELLEERDAGRISTFEEIVLELSIPVTRALHEEYQQLMSQRQLHTGLNIDEISWLPRFRNPDELWSAYADVQYPASSRQAALEDLRHLGIPSGLSRDQFAIALRISLRQQHVVSELFGFLTQPRSFGEVRNWFASRFPSVDATLGCQVLLRWVKVILSDQVAFEASPYSEVTFLR
jgi:hypothetical protein